MTLDIPPFVIDLEQEMLLLKGDHWSSPTAVKPAIGDRIGVRCRNRGEYTLFGAALLQDMAGEYRPTHPGTRRLEQNTSVTFGMDPTSEVRIGYTDVCYVLMITPDQNLLQAFLNDPNAWGANSEGQIRPFTNELEIELPQKEPSDADLSRLTLLAETPYREMTTIALEALCLLRPPIATRRRLVEVLNKSIRDPYHISRPWLISVACNLDDSNLRRQIRAIAADAADPDSSTAQLALAEVGDPYAIPYLESLLKASPQQRINALRLLAMTGPDRLTARTIESVESDEAEDEDRALFWRTIAAVRQGDIHPLDEHVTRATSRRFFRLAGSEANLFWAARFLTPLTRELQEYIDRTRQLTSEAIEGAIRPVAASALF